jgi:ABC-type polysaccharide/polyol phosphate transport system ATPase subunit
VPAKALYLRWWRVYSCPPSAGCGLWAKSRPCLNWELAFILTGRENIFLNGTLLGHSRHEIADRLDEVLDFAQLDGFVDAPLRTYSSGMVARLGFSVATAWEPEILLLDETLAVGDEAFRAKCITRLEGFRDRGTTTLLVSHDPSLVQARCNRVALLDKGHLKAIGSAEEIIHLYHQESLN